MRTIDDILPSLVAATNDGKLEWERDGELQDCYVTSIRSYRFRIWHWLDEDDHTSSFTAQLMRGPNVVDGVTTSQYSPKYQVMQTVHDAARRSYMGVDAIIGDIEEELAKLMR